MCALGEAQRFDKRSRADEINLVDHRDRQRDQRHDQKPAMLEQRKRLGKCKRTLLIPRRRRRRQREGRP